MVLHDPKGRRHGAADGKRLERLKPVQVTSSKLLLRRSTDRGRWTFAPAFPVAICQLGAITRAEAIDAAFMPIAKGENPTCGASTPITSPPQMNCLASGQQDGAPRPAFDLGGEPSRGAVRS